MEQKIMTLLCDDAFRDRLFGFAYNRCQSRHDAEDLYSKIIVALAAAAKRETEIRYAEPYTWAVAHKVYAAHCQERARYSSEVNIYGIRELPDEKSGIDALEDDMETRFLVGRVRREIALLSQAYRDVTVMYYIDGMSVQRIAASLGVTVSAVKQRLFHARTAIRTTIKSEAEDMSENDLSLRPVNMSFWGNGKYMGETRNIINDPSPTASRAFTKNIVCLCDKKERTPAEIASILGVPSLYVEEEMDLLCRGSNGEYGLLRQVSPGRYKANFVIISIDEYFNIIDSYAPEITEAAKKLCEYINHNKEKYLSFPFTRKQTDLGFVLWGFVNRIAGNIGWKISGRAMDKYLGSPPQSKRPFTTTGITYGNNCTRSSRFCGCDGVASYNICGYKKVFAVNMYNDRLPKHFACGHDIQADNLLTLTIRAAENGLPVSDLTESEREYAAKAVERGYLDLADDVLFPRVLILGMEHEKEFYDAVSNIDINAEAEIDSAAEKLAKAVRRNLSPDLLCDAEVFMGHCLNDVVALTIDGCLAAGMLNEPSGRGESVVIMLEK